MRRIIRTMIRTAAAVLSLLMTVGALAHDGDLRVTVDMPSSGRAGERFVLTATVENIGSGVAPNVRAHLRIEPGLECRSTIELGDLAPGESRVVSCSQVILGDQPYYYIEGMAGADTDPLEPEARRHNNFVRQYAERLSDGVEFEMYIWDRLPVPKPGLPFPFRLGFRNYARNPATNTTITITTSEGSFADLPPECTAEANRAVCRLGTIEVPPIEQHTNLYFLSVNIVAPDRSEATFTVDAKIESDLPDERPHNQTPSITLTTFRTFNVTEATDTALRNALLAADASCGDVPYLVAFRIPSAAGTKWHRIEIESALDLVHRGGIEIDGTTQTGYFGDTNPDGPEIEIDGSAVRGNGIVIPSGCGNAVRGLALNGFGESAVFVYDGQDVCKPVKPALVEHNTIGTDPTGMHARPNERGVFVAAASGAQIAGNVISGNRRTAVFVDRGRAVITRNVIGLNRTLDAALPKGASGVYVAAGGHGTDINDNSIGFNAHFGIGIDRGAEHVALQGNSFQANGGLAIDWGLDGPLAEGPVKTPAIVSARYANGVTTVEVDVDMFNGGTFPQVALYASDAPDPSGFGEGQYFLGSWRYPFRIEVPVDLRGKWLSITFTRVSYLAFVRTNDNTGDYRTTTSEMSRAVEVQ
jgi:Right handed beta helix region/CARDB